MAKIGIRLADGKFYPILEDGEPVKKRLVVTTVKDDQASVQIDVYRKADEDVSGNSYIGSLIIENIPPGAKGSPDIRLDLGLDEHGNLNAYALEEATGEHQTLTVSLRALAEEEKYEIPDFDFQEDEAGSGTGYETTIITDNDSPFDFDIPESEDSGTAPAEPPSSIPFSFEEEAPEDETEEKKKASPLLIGLLAAVAVIILFGLAYMIFQVTADRAPAAPTAPATVQAPATPAPASAAPAAAPTPAPAVATPAAAPAKATPPASAPASPQVAPGGTKAPGVWYKVRWGDTLWDLSIAYYRTPWLYGNIAKANKLANPDLIISGSWIYIPPR
ncbi:MAG: Hsp70 family protein [Clostridia bacterium]